MTGSKIIMFNLRDLLSYAKLSQKEFAKMIDSSESSVSKYLSGERSPSVMTIIKICEAFPSFSPNDFIFEDGVKKKAELIKLDAKFNRKEMIEDEVNQIS